MLGGIGFTMSLFIGTLAFPDPVHAAQLRLGVLAGSIVSAVVGYLQLVGSGSDPLRRP
jgi:Na+:H+ antiporter, NhaA family